MNLFIANFNDLVIKRKNMFPFWANNKELFNKKFDECLNTIISTTNADKVLFIFDNSYVNELNKELFDMLEIRYSNNILKTKSENIKAIVNTLSSNIEVEKIFLYSNYFVSDTSGKVQLVKIELNDIVNVQENFDASFQELAKVLEKHQLPELASKYRNFEELKANSLEIFNLSIRQIIENTTESTYDLLNFDIDLAKISQLDINANQNTKSGYKILDVLAMEQELNKVRESLTFKIFYDGSKPYYGTPIAGGFILDNNEDVIVCKFQNNDLKFLKKIMENSKIRKMGFDIKEDVVLLKKSEIEVNNISEDAMILGYVLDASANEYSLSTLVDKYIHENILNKDEFQGKGKTFRKLDEIDEKSLFEYINLYIKSIHVLTKELLNIIKIESGLNYIYKEIEIPLIEVLADMEFEGFKVDINILNNLKLEFGTKIIELEKIIYHLAGTTFNINSPKQLGEILFVDLGLPIIKKTKTGYSTNVEVLEQLYDIHPIIKEILEYRKLNKIVTTYVDGFRELIDEESKIHTTFNQALTTTGRISSTDPNLQNIPVRSEEGRLIRKMFVSSDSQKILVDADYSQIELRVLAHVSEDENLIEAYKQNLDIHAKTAIEVFGAKEGNVDGDLRRKAKAVNFGIVYGISDFGLSKDLNISIKEAKIYIEQYLNYFSGVKKYMDDVVVKARINGCVDTFLGRKRLIPELESSNKMIQSFGERIALNTPIQGSAADIIKIAMIKVYKKLKEYNLKSKLILQVHDELIIDAEINELMIVQQILREEMEGAVKLSVPLKIDMNTGVSWYESK